MQITQSKAKLLLWTNANTIHLHIIHMLKFKLILFK